MDLKPMPPSPLRDIDSTFSQGLGRPGEVWKQEVAVGAGLPQRRGLQCLKFTPGAPVSNGRGMA